MPSHRLSRQKVQVTSEIRSSTPSVVRRSASPTFDLASPIAPKGQASLRDVLDETRPEDCLAEFAAGPPAAARTLPFMAPAVGKLRPRMPIMTGFDRLDFSVASLIERLPPAALEDKFNLVAEWIDRFNVDVSASRLVKLLTPILDAAEAQESPAAHQVLSHLSVLSSSVPLAARSMAAAFAAQQLLLCFGTLHPVAATTVQRVTRFLLDAIYVNPLRELSARPLRDDDDHAVVRRSLAPFKGRMHLQASRDSAKRLTALEQFVLSHEEVAERQRRVIQQCVRKWQCGQLRLTLKAWRKAVLDSRRDKKAAAEQQVLDQRLAALQGEVAQLKSSVAMLEGRLATATERERELERELSAASKKHEYEAHSFERALSARDCLVEDLEASLKAGEATRVELLASCEERYRALGNAVVQSINTQADASGAGRLAAARRTVMKVLEGGRDDGPGAEASAGLAPVKPLDPRRGADVSVIEWLKRTLRFADPDGRVAQPASIAANSQCLDAFALCAQFLFPHLDTASDALARLLGAASPSSKAALLVEWLQAVGFTTPHGFSAEALTRTNREGAATMSALFAQLMASVCCPDLFANGLPKEAPRHDPLPVRTADDPPLGPGDVTTLIAQHCSDQHRGAYAAARLGVAAWCSTSAALASVAAGATKSVTLSADEKADQHAFFLNHQLLTDVCTRDEQDLLQAVVDQHYPTLRGAFLHYSGDEGKVLAQHTTVSPADLYRMLVDCRAITPNVVDRETLSNYALNALDPRRWLSALIRIARAKHASEASATDSFKVFLEMHIIAFAELPDLTAAPIVAKEDSGLSSLLAQYRNDLFKVFRAYCKDASNANKLLLPHYDALLRDAGLQLTEVSESVAARIFHRVKAGVADDGITFDAFIAALCWCAVHVFRDPFQRTATKVRRFIFGRVLPAYRHKFRLTFTVVE
jgi:hypothetical protein